MRHLPDEHIQALFEELETAALSYAKAKAECEGLKEDRKITKAQLMNIAEAEGKTSIVKQEVFAYSHPTYQSIIKKLRGAIERETISQYQCKLCELRFDAWRTVNANERAATR